MKITYTLSLFLSAAIPLPAGSPAPLDKPFVGMYTEVNRSDEARALNNLPPTELNRRLADLTRWYKHFHCEQSRIFTMGDESADASGVTLASKLVKRGVLVSNYRNGSYVSQANAGDITFGEAAGLERAAPLAIGAWWPGHKDQKTGSESDDTARLTVGINTDQAEVRLSSTAKFRPAGTPETWPYVPSRGTGADPGQVFSTDTHNFVSWVRVEDEVMRVRDVKRNGAEVILVVDRGYFGTAKARHAAGERVLSPIYIGGKAAAKWDFGLAGSPAVDNPKKALRYGIKVWQGPESGPGKDAITWLAARIKATFGSGKPAPYLQGYNAAWLDITSCSPYNNSDPYANPVYPWDNSTNSLPTPDQWGDYQLAKVRGLRKQFGGKSGYPEIQFFANNLSARGAEFACSNRLIGSGEFAGASLEHWLQDAKAWHGLMAQSFDIQQRDLPALYWVKWQELGSGLTVSQYKRFTYGAYLLSYNAEAKRPVIGGPFGLQKPDEIYFWNWGKALTRPSSVKELGIQNGKLYRRDYEKGSIVVNPTAEPATVNLTGRYYDASRPETARTAPVSSVTIGAQDAAFLLKEQVSEGVLP
jgi:hypothetical protein